MIRPTDDAVEPRFKSLKFAVAKLEVEFFQQEHGGHFFFQHRATEKMISDLDQEVEPVFLSYFPPKTEGGAAQIRRVPSVRFNFVLEEPLHARGMLCSAALFQRTANPRGDFFWRCLGLSRRTPNCGTSTHRFLFWGGVSHSEISV